MNRILTLIAVFLMFLNVKSQKFDVNLGAEYRITPFNLYNSESYPQDIIYDRDRQLSGIAFVIDGDYELFKNFKIGIAQSIRYDEKYFSNLDGKNIKGLIYDTNINFKYEFKLRQFSMFSLLGYSFMNNNTEYEEKKIFQTDANGNPTSIATTINDFSFNAYTFGIGYNYHKMKFLIGMHYILKEHNFSKYGISPIGLPFLQLKYNIYNF